MRALKLTLLLIIGWSGGLFAQTTYYSLGGDWSLNSSWSTVGFGGAGASSTPGPLDIVNIGGGVTINVNDARSCATVVFSQTTGPLNQILISSTGSLTVSGTITIPRNGNLSPNGNILNVGDGTLTAGNVAFTTGTAPGTNQVVVNGGLVDVSGNISGFAGAGTLTLISFTGAGRVEVAGTVFTSTTGAINAGSSGQFEYDGAGQTVQALAYRNLILAGTGTKAFTTTTTLIAGDLTIDGVTTNVPGLTLEVAGTTTVNSGGSINFITSAGGTKTFIGLVTINAGATWNNAINEGFTFRGGITNNGSGNWTGGTTGTYAFNTILPVTTQTITGEVNAPTITVAASTTNLINNGTITANTVTVTGGAVDLTNNGTLTVNTSLGGTGELIQGAGSTLNLGGTSTITTFNTSGSGNTVNYTGALQTVRGVNYQNLGLSGTGSKTLAVGTTTIAGNLTITLAVTATATAVIGLTVGGNVILNGGTFDGVSFTHTVGGNWLTNGGAFSPGSSTVLFNRAGDQTIGGTGPSGFNNITLAGSGTKTFAQEMDATGTLNINLGVVADLGALTTHGANRLRFDGASQPAGIWGSVASPASPPNESDAYFTPSSLGTIAIAAGGFTYYSRVTGSWADPNTWSTISFGGAAGSGFPVATDEVFIGGGFTVTVAVPAAAAIIGFQDAGSTNNSLVVDPGQTLTVSGSITIPRNGNSNTLAIGAGTVTAANLALTTGTGLGIHSVTVSTGTLTVSGNITGIGTSSELNLSGNGLVQVGGTMFPSGSGLLTSAAAGRFEYTGVAQTVQALTYGTLILSGSGTKPLSASATTTVSGSLTVNGTTLNVAGSSLSVTGPTTVNSGGSLAFVSSAANTKTFTGLVTINTGGTWNNAINEGFTFQGGITNNGTWNGGTAGTYLFNNSTQAITGSVNAPTVTVTGAAIDLINNGTFTASVALGGTGEFIQGAGATLNLGGTSTVTTFTATAAGNTVNYTGGAQTVRAVNYQNLGLSGSGVKTLGLGTTSIGGNFTMSGSVSATAVVGLTIGGNLTLGSGTTFNTGAFVHSVAGDITNNALTFNTASSTVVLNRAGAQAIGGTSPLVFNNLTFSGSGVKSLGASTTINGTFIINTGAQADLGAITTHTANALRLGGGPVPAGVWGGTGSGAANINTTVFAPGTGTITVATGAFTYYLFDTGLAWTNPDAWSTVDFVTDFNAGSFPVAGDEVFIGGGRSVRIEGAQACAVVTFDQSTGPINEILIIGSNSLTVSGSITIPRNSGGSNILSVGAGTLSAGSISFTNGSGVAAVQRVTVSTGTVSVSGSISGYVASPPAIPAAGTLLEATGNGLIQVGGTMFPAGSGILTALGTSRFEYTGTAQTVQALTYGSLILSGSGIKTLAASTSLATGGNLTVNATTFNVAGVSLTVPGTTTVNAGGTLAFVTSNAGTKQFTGLVTVNAGGIWNNVINEGFTLRGGINNQGTFNAGTAGTYLFDTGVAQSITSTSSISFPAITVTGASVVLTNSILSPNSLTVGTLTGTGRITQAANAVLNITAASTITNMTATAAGNTVNFTGAGPQTINSVPFVNLGLSGSGLKSFQAGTTSIAGNLSIGGTASATAAVGMDINGSVTIGVGTTFTAGAFTHLVAGNWTNNGTFVALGSTIVLDGAAQSIGGTTDPANFHNLTAAGTGIKTLGTRLIANGATNVNSGVQVDLGGLTNATNVLILAGAAQPTGTYTSGTTPVFFTGAGSLNVGLSVFYSRVAGGNWNVATNWSNENHTGAVATRTPDIGDVVVIGEGRSIVVTDSRTCTSLIFDSSVAASDSLVVQPGGTLNVTGDVNIPRKSGINRFAVDGTATVGNIDMPNGGGGVQEVKVGAAGQLTVLGNITGNPSAVVRYTGPGLVQVAGTMYSNGSLNTTFGGRFEYNGGSQVVQNLAYRDLIISGSGTKTLGAGILVAGNFTVRDNAAISIGNAITVNGTTTVGGGTSGSLTISSGTGAKIFVGLVTINSGATWSNTTHGVTFRGGITNASGGTFNAGTGTQTFNTTASQPLNGVLVIPSISITSPTNLTNNGTLTVSSGLAGGGQFTQAAGATLNVGAASVTVTTFTATATGNTVDYNAAGGQTVRAVNYYNLSLSGAGIKTLPGVGTIGVAGSWNNSGSPVTSTGSTVVFNGTAAQSVTTNNRSFNNVTTTKSAGTAVTLIGEATVTGALTLTVGNLIFTDSLRLNGTFAGANLADRLLAPTSAANLVVGGTGSLGTLFFAPSANVLNSFRLNRSSAGAAALGNAVTVSSSLRLTNGTLTNGSFLTLGSGATLTRTNDGTLTAAPIGGFFNLAYVNGSSNNCTTGVEFVSGSVNDIAINLTGTLTQNSSFILQGTMSFGPTASFNSNGFTLIVNSNSDVADFSNATDVNGRIGQIQGGSFIGNVTVERFMGQEGSFNRYVASPVSGRTLANLVATFALVNNRAQRYSEPTSGNANQGFQNVALTANLDPGRGYLVFPTPSFAANDIIWEVTGPLNTGQNQGSVNFATVATGSLTYTPSTPTPLPDADGFNLLGNPYPSPIVWSNNPAQWTSSNVGSFIYVQDVANGSFMTFDHTNPIFNTLPNGVISTGQAFWVKATGAGPSLIVHEAAKTGLSGEFFRSDTPPRKNEGLAITMKQGRATDRAWLLIESSSELGFDANDISKLHGELMGVYFNVDGRKMIANSMDRLPAEDIFVEVFTGKTNDFNLNFEAVGEWADFNKLYLVDRVEQVVQRISETATYSFRGVAGFTYRDRFVLTVKPEKVVFAEQSLQIFPNPAKNMVRVALGKSDTGVLAIFNMSGQQLMEVAVTSTAVVDVDLSALPAGMYVARMRGQSGVSSTKIVKE